MDQVLNQLLTSATRHRDQSTGEAAKLFYEGMCQAYMSLHTILLAQAVTSEIEAKKSLLDENKRLTNDLLTANIENGNLASDLRHLTTAPVAKPWVRPIVPEVEDRQGITIPEGYEAERDAEGRATGRVVAIEEQ